MFSYFSRSELQRPAKKMSVAVIGAAGKKGTEYLRALMKRADLEISAVVINKSTSQLIEQLEKQGVQVIREGRVDELIANVMFDIAVVSVPHHEHHLITDQLLHAGKYIVKEKPLAVSLDFATEYASSIAQHKFPCIFTTLQRNTMPSFVQAKEKLSLIGKPINFTYHYWFNLPTVTTGWRSKMATAFGGVVLDMGYHILDVITHFFGSSSHIVSANIAYQYPETEQEQLEDYAEIAFEYHLSELKGVVILDRHAIEKKEIFIIEGQQGRMIITPQGYQIFDLSGASIEDVSCPISKEEEITAMFNLAISNSKNALKTEQDFSRNMHNMLLLKQIDEQKKLKISDFKHDSTVDNERLRFLSKSNGITIPNDLVIGSVNKSL